MNAKNETMNIKDMSLGQLVQTIENADYEEKYSMDINGKIWRMYTKDESRSLRMAYISDVYGLLSTETFANLKDEEEEKEKKRVEKILLEYEKGMIKIKEAASYKPSPVWAIVVGGVLGGLASRSPIGAGLGAVCGYAFTRLSKNPKVAAAEAELGNYLSRHRIKTGDDALYQLLLEYSRKDS